MNIYAQHADLQRRFNKLLGVVEELTEIVREVDGNVTGGPDSLGYRYDSLLDIEDKLFRLRGDRP